MIAGILAIPSPPPVISIVQTVQTTEAVGVVSDPNRSLVYVLDMGKSGKGIYRRDSVGRYGLYAKAEAREYLVGTDRDGKPVLLTWQPMTVVGPAGRQFMPNLSYHLSRFCSGVQLGFSGERMVADWSETGMPFFSPQKHRETVRPGPSVFSAAVSPDRSTLAVSFHDFTKGSFRTTPLGPDDDVFTERPLLNGDGTAYGSIIVDFAFLDASTIVALTMPAAKRDPDGFRDDVYDGSFPKSMSLTMSLVDIDSGKVRDLRRVQVAATGMTRLAPVDGKGTVALMTSPQQLTIIKIKRP